MAINFHKKSNIHYIPKHCSGEGDGRGKKQSSWLQKFNHEHLQTSKLLVRTLLMSSRMNLIWAANIQTMKKYKHAEYYEISYTERIIVKYSTQACRHSWNIQHRANLKKKYSRLNEIPIGKLQLPSSGFSTNTLGMGQLTHSKTGLHNSNNDLFEIIDFLMYLSQFSYSLLSILP